MIKAIPTEALDSLLNSPGTWSFQGIFAFQVESLYKQNSVMIGGNLGRGQLFGEETFPATFLLSSPLLHRRGPLPRAGAAAAGSWVLPEVRRLGAEGYRAAVLPQRPLRLCPWNVLWRDLKWSTLAFPKVCFIVIDFLALSLHSTKSFLKACPIFRGAAARWVEAAGTETHGPPARGPAWLSDTTVSKHRCRSASKMHFQMLIINGNVNLS